MTSEIGAPFKMEHEFIWLITHDGVETGEISSGANPKFFLFDLLILLSLLLEIDSIRKF